MELDFRGLNSIAGAEFEEARKKDPPREPQAGLFEGGPYIDTPREKNTAEGREMALDGMGALQREAERRTAALENAADVYRRYQRDAIATAQLQAEILRGVKAGEGIYSLFLKATKAISLTVDNDLFYRQIAGDIPAIYGAGLLEAEPIELELKATEERLERLIAAEERETQADTRNRIQAAIRAHRERIAELKDKLGSRQGRTSIHPCVCASD